MNIFMKIKLYTIKTFIKNIIPEIHIKTENKFICWIWSVIYSKWINHYHTKYNYKVVAVKGWRTILVEQQFNDGTKGLRETITPCFWGLE